MDKQGTSPRRAHILSVGPFGRAVGRHLRRFRPDVAETPVNDDTMPMPEMWPESRVSIVAAWRPVPTLCELLEELSYEWHRPMIPVVAESAVLRLGPVVVPGRGSCWTCWVQRSRQHSDWREQQSSLLEYYASHPEAGPQGYLEAFAMMAAARLNQIIEDLDSSREVAGHIWQIDMMTREITTGTLVGIHDCPRCGLHRDPKTRSYTELQRDLSYLWTQPNQGTETTS